MKLPDGITLRPCPFCGGKAVIGEASWTGIPKIECSNYGRWVDGKFHGELGCHIRPSTYTGSDFIRDFYKGKKDDEIIRIIAGIWNGGEL